MALARIQITQGVIVGGDGHSVVGLDPTTLITLTDAGGAGATSYLWECLSFPAPSASAPTITNSTSQVATITPAPSLTDGVYLIRLTRTDPTDGTTSDIKYFAVDDDDGLSLPSPGQNRNNSNVGGSALAQAAGWFGSLAGGTNRFLDAFLRLRKKREGKFDGRSSTSSHTAAITTTVVYTYGASDPVQDLSLEPTGSGEYRADLSVTGAEDGSIFRFLLTYKAGAGNFVLRNGSGGSTIITLTAPPSGTTKYLVGARYDGTNWVLRELSAMTALALPSKEEFLLVAGNQSSSEDTYQRAGTVRVDPSTLPANAQFRFEASFDTSNAGNAALVRLFNVTDATAVGAPMTTTSTITQTQSAIVTLPGSLKEYEVQVKLTAADEEERATVTRARIVATWG